jgi:hypothetical protein
MYVTNVTDSPVPFGFADEPGQVFLRIMSEPYLEPRVQTQWIARCEMKLRHSGRLTRKS